MDTPDKKYIADKLFKFRNWLLPLSLAFCYFLFKEIQIFDFGSPYLDDWIILNSMICLFWAFFTILCLLIISTYYEIKSNISSPGIGLEDAKEAKNKSLNAFTLAFEFFNLMILAIIVFVIFWTVSWFVLFFAKSQEQAILISSVVTFLLLISMKKTRIFLFFKKAFFECLFYVKIHKGKAVLYSIILTSVFPLCCYRFELTTNEQLFPEKLKEKILVADVNLGGMASAYRRNQLSLYLSGEHLQKDISLETKNIGKLKHRAIMNLADLPKGEYKIIALYRKKFMTISWHIKREVPIQVL